MTIFGQIGFKWTLNTVSYNPETPTPQFTLFLLFYQCIGVSFWSFSTGPGGGYHCIMTLGLFWNKSTSIVYCLLSKYLRHQVQYCQNLLGASFLQIIQNLHSSITPAFIGLDVSIPYSITSKMPLSLQMHSLTHQTAISSEVYQWYDL